MACESVHQSVELLHITCEQWQELVIQQCAVVMSYGTPDIYRQCTIATHSIPNHWVGFLGLQKWHQWHELIFSGSVAAQEQKRSMKDLILLTCCSFQQ